MFQLQIPLPDITHYATAVAGAMRHQYHQGQTGNPVRVQAAVAFIGLIYRLGLHAVRIMFKSPGSPVDGISRPSATTLFHMDIDAG